MWTIIGHRLKQNKRGASTVVAVVLGLVIIVVIVSNVVLWSYEMNQMDWEKTNEDITITDVTSVTNSSWFVAQTEYTVNTGSLVNGTYQYTQTANNIYEAFQEEVATVYQLETLRPNAAGQYELWSDEYPSGSAHWTLCDETSPDDDSTYVENRVGALRKDSYNLQDPAGSGTINWVRVYVRTRLTASGDSVIRTLIRTYGTDYESSDITLSTSYQDKYTEYNTNPFTGSAWTWTEMTSLEVGASSLRSGAAANVRMTAVWVVANYTSTNYTFDMNGTFTLDLPTYPLDYIQTVEIQLKCRADDTGEDWYLKAYNWTAAAYNDSGFNNTSGHTPSSGWDTYAVNLTDKWRSYVNDSGTIYVKLKDNQVDFNQTTIDVDFLGVRVKIDGARFTFKNEGSVTSHMVSLWIINSTLHRRYDMDIIMNSAEISSYLRADISLPSGSYTVKAVTGRGNKAIYSGS